MPAEKASSKSPTVALPPALVTAVQNKRVIMFLGAGASMTATKKGGGKPPSGADLRKALGDEFFHDPMEGYDLMAVADMAIQAHSQSIVFEKIHKMLDPFEPSVGHKLLPRFHWRELATTNYDQLIERAYDKAENPLQSVIPFVKNSEPIEEKQHNVANPVVLLKLHGCLSHMHDEHVPLILSHEHYALYSKHRERLFNRLHDKGYESTIIFCGYSLGDSHIRNIIHQLQDEGVKRPMWYIVSPFARDQEVSYWASMNVSVIRTTFDDFMLSLDAAIPEMWRQLEPGAGLTELPIQKHFKTRADPSQLVRTALGRDLRHVHVGMPIEMQIPKKFYEGYDTGWGAIANNLDVKRRIVDDLLLEAIADDEQSNRVRFHLLRGPAGCGKSVALKRAAWTAALELDQVVLWLEDGGLLAPDVILELHHLIGKRIVLFVDRATDRWREISDLLLKAKSSAMALSVIAAERDSDWNVYGPRTDSTLYPSEIRVGHLTTPEIEKLVDLLTEHGSLGLLEDYTRREQVEAFSQKADRQLLVALYEVTRGLPFARIIFDEYEGITPDRARRLYLDICALHQFGASVRAGTISRATGIRFPTFETELMKPLENVVLVERDIYSGDMSYRSRHPKVAELVFRQACPDDMSKADKLIRLIEQLDVGYSVDRYTMEQIARGRKLAELIRTAAQGREVYQAILRAEPDQAHVFQQWAIYEMQVNDGSFDDAETYSAKAAELAPNNRIIAHTRVEVSRRRAQEERSPIRRDLFRQQARQRLGNVGSGSDKPVIVTRCKLLIDEISDLLKGASEEGNTDLEDELQEKVRETEGLLRRGHQIFPDDPDVLTTEADLMNALGKSEKGVLALERAWNAKPRGAGVAIRLAKSYLKNGLHEKALVILRSGLERYPDDKTLHLELGRVLVQTSEAPKVALSHLERSYLDGDSNFLARHLHAQAILLAGDPNKAMQLFDFIGQNAPHTFTIGSSNVRTTVTERLGRCRGRISRKEATFAIVSTGIYPKEVRALQRHTQDRAWEELATGNEVEFTVGFNHLGPLALDCARLG